MDTIWLCAYSFDLNVQNNNQNNEYFLAAEQVFKDATKFKFFNFLSSIIFFFEYFDYGQFNFTLLFFL